MEGAAGRHVHEDGRSRSCTASEASDLAERELPI
jgi:hypothetical protein